MQAVRPRLARARASLVAAAACVWLAAAGAAPSLDGGQSATVVALERYAAGEFEAAVEHVVARRSIGAAGREFRRDARAWIDRASADDRHHRLRTAAALAVEIMAGSYRRDSIQYRDSREIVEWTCERLRQNPVSDFERWFHLTSIALMQGARDENMLAGVPINLAVAIPGGESHVLHGGLRFPEDSRFKLAYVTLRFEVQFVSTRPLPPGYLLDAEWALSWVQRAGQSQHLDDTLEKLGWLTSDPVVGAEARLRGGVLRFLRGQTAAAERDLAAVTEAADPAVRYIAHLMLGTITEQREGPAAALAAYRAAHATVPAAASSVALASALYRTGRPDEAAAVLAAFAAAPPPADPWRLYGQREYRRVEEYRAAMREAIGQ